ncbi:COG1361 S-layer family protein [Natrinema hispanicum]|uniref:COG1361 S-layer family protein n=1 Tax=Natrinema hispanicum TaxID=392421 RepID=UPI001F5F4D04|nr:CARDB domain-containing protein [Natrinema hispanicum]
MGAGNEQALTVEVTNNLNQTVTDVEARIFADDPLSTGDDDTGYVESLKPGESVTMSFELSAAESATEKTYPVSFDFRYDDERGNSQLSNTIRVPMSVSSSDGWWLPTDVDSGRWLARRWRSRCPLASEGLTDDNR